MKRLIGLAVLGCLAGCNCSPHPGLGNPDGGRTDGGLTVLPDGAVLLPDGGTTSVGSSCGVNSYLCGGSCVVTVTDPNNCGGCGIQCSSSQVCAQSRCMAPGQCPQGTQACNGTCVDFSSDNNNCGTCNHACGSGTGCVGGGCVPSIRLDGGGPSCSGGGPPITVTSDAGTSCTGSLAQVTFRWGLCTCTNINISDVLHTDAFDSQLGGQDAGLLGGGVGADGRFGSSAAFDIGGTGWFADGGVDTSSGPDNVSLDLWVGGSTTGGGLNVGHDAHVDGNATGLTVGGNLYVPNNAAAAGATVSGSVIPGAFTVPPPCDCAPNQLINVAGIVADGQARNDNATLGLAANALENPSAARLDLPCGRYYLTRITNSSPVTVGVHGRTAIFIGGDVTPSDTLTVTLDANAELDIFIGGGLNSSSNLTFGSTLVPAQTRIYIAGSNVGMSASALIAGEFYLPWAAFGPSSGLDLYGSMFCGSYGSSSQTNIHYDRAVLSAGVACGAPPPPRADGGPGVIPDAGCGSCRDCNNQACVGGTCANCATDSQCCAPLVCRSGFCQVLFQ